MSFSQKVMTKTKLKKKQKTVKINTARLAKVKIIGVHRPTDTLVALYMQL